MTNQSTPTPDEMLRRARILIEFEIACHAGGGDETEYMGCDLEPCNWCIVAKELLSQMGEGYKTRIHEPSGVWLWKEAGRINPERVIL